MKGETKFIKRHKKKKKNNNNKRWCYIFRKDRNHIDIPQIPVMLCCTVGCIKGE